MLTDKNQQVPGSSVLGNNHKKSLCFRLVLLYCHDPPSRSSTMITCTLLFHPALSLHRLILHSAHPCPIYNMYKFLLSMPTFIAELTSLSLILRSPTFQQGSRHALHLSRQSALDSYPGPLLLHSNKALYTHHLTAWSSNSTITLLVCLIPVSTVLNTLIGLPRYLPNLFQASPQLNIHTTEEGFRYLCAIN